MHESDDLLLKVTLHIPPYRLPVEIPYFRPPPGAATYGLRKELVREWWVVIAGRGD